VLASLRCWLPQFDASTIRTQQAFEAADYRNFSTK
jgi:hypothetical protein